MRYILWILILLTVTLVNNNIVFYTFVSFGCMYIAKEIIEMLKLLK